MSRGTIGIVVRERDVPAEVAAIARYEAAGVPAAWMTTGGLGPDAITTFAAAAVQTERILLGTCIVPLFPRHPLAMAQQVSVVAALAPGRFRLGIGPSHGASVEATFGIPFKAPLTHLREYITILKRAFAGEVVDVDGTHYHAHGKLGQPPREPVPVMGAALRANAFRLCGEIADGAITWLCPLPYVRDIAVPAIEGGAQAAKRPAPPLIAHVPFSISTDVNAVRAAARQQLASYPRMPFYARMFQDAGMAEASRGEWSDEMIDRIVAHGSTDQVGEQLRAFVEAGAGEVLAMPVLVEGDREAQLASAAELLGKLAS
jgi:F420-dependent oxidoreductase-like protein